MKRIQVTVLRDKKGRYVIIRGKKYRIKPEVSHSKIKAFVKSKISKPERGSIRTLRKRRLGTRARNAEKFPRELLGVKPRRSMALGAPLRPYRERVEIAQTRRLYPETSGYENKSTDDLYLLAKNLGIDTSKRSRANIEIAIAKKLSKLEREEEKTGTRETKEEIKLPPPRRSTRRRAPPKKFLERGIGKSTQEEIDNIDFSEGYDPKYMQDLMRRGESSTSSATRRRRAERSQISEEEKSLRDKGYRTVPLPPSRPRRQLTQEEKEEIDNILAPSGAEEKVQQAIARTVRPPSRGAPRERPGGRPTRPISRGPKAINPVTGVRADFRGTRTTFPQEPEEEKKVVFGTDTAGPTSAEQLALQKPEEKQGLSEEQRDELSTLAEHALDIFGKGRVENHGDGTMSNFDIDKVMGKYPQYLGCIAHNELKSKILPKVKPGQTGCCVINTDPASKPGEHWQALYWSPKEKEIDFFDSYADPIDPALQKDIKTLAEKLNCNTYLKLKENKICVQNDKSSNCGWFSCQFLIDRLRGKPFADASGYNDSQKGEANVEKFKTQHGGFGYISSFGQEGDGFLDTFVFPSNTIAPTSVTVFERHKNDVIVRATIVRKPIFKTIDKVLNWISLGKWNDAKKESGYDQMFHLSLVVYSSNGIPVKIEKNEKIVLSDKYESMSTEQFQGLTVKNEMTIGELFEKTKARIGDHRFYQYNAYENNCQDFVLNLTSTLGALTPTTIAFVKQDTTTIIKRLPRYVRWFSQGVTDLGAKLSEFFGKFQRGNGNVLSPSNIILSPAREQYRQNLLKAIYDLQMIRKTRPLTPQEERRLYLLGKLLVKLSFGYRPPALRRGGLSRERKNLQGGESSFRERMIRNRELVRQKEKHSAMRGKPREKLWWEKEGDEKWGGRKPPHSENNIRYQIPEWASGDNDIVKALRRRPENTLTQQQRAFLSQFYAIMSARISEEIRIKNLEGVLTDDQEEWLEEQEATFNHLADHYA